MNRIWGEGKTCLGRELVVQSLVLPGIAQGEEQASSCCKKMNEKKMNEKKMNEKKMNEKKTNIKHCHF